MKKKIMLVLLSFCMLLLCSCEKRTYGLIELSSLDLVSYIINNDDCNIVFAIYVDQAVGADEMMEGLEKIAKNTQKNIYYIDGNHVDSASSMILYDGLEIEYADLIYIVYENGSEVIYKNYTDYETMASDLSLYKSDYEVPKEDVNAEEIIKKTDDYYNEGKISLAYDTLSTGWTNEVAKKYYDEHELLYLINNWEAYYTYNGKVTAYKLIFLNGYNYVYYVEKKDDVENISIENDDYKEYVYVVENNVIKITDSDTNKVVKSYKIEYLSKKNLILSDGNKNITFNTFG